MPYDIRKLPDKEKWRVYNKDTGRIASKATTKEKAEAQRRLLYMIERKKAKSVGGRLIEKIKALDKACWEGYEAIGMKKKGNRKVPNCVPIKGGVLMETDAEGNPLHKNKTINKLNISYNLLRQNLLDLLDDGNVEAHQDIEDIRDGMGNLATQMVRLEDRRDDMTDDEFDREARKIFEKLTSYFREAGRYENLPRPEEGDSDVEGFGLGQKWVYCPHPIKGAGGGSSKITPISPDELTRMVYASRPSLVLKPAKREPIPSLEEQRTARAIIASNTARNLAEELDNKRFVPKKGNWLSGTGNTSSKARVAPEPEPLAPYEQEGLARMRAERRERELREIEEREAKRIADARAERLAKEAKEEEDKKKAKEEAIKKKRQEALAKARAEKKRKADALRLARQDSSKSVSSGTSEDR